MSEEKLLPCPFCGDEPELHWINEAGEVLTAWVRCKCGCEHHERLTREVAVKKWNSRHLPNEAQTPTDTPETVAAEVAYFEAHAERFAEAHKGIAAAAQAPTKPSSDDRPIPTYGQISWQQLGRDVMDAMYAKRTDYEFDPSYYPGHQMLPALNFNSLARIVDKYRYYGASAVSSAGNAAQASPKPSAWRACWVSLNTSRMELFEDYDKAAAKGRETGGCVIPLYTAPAQASCDRGAQALRVVRQMVEAFASGNLKMSSPEIGEPENDIPYHPWHAELLHYARLALEPATPSVSSAGRACPSYSIPSQTRGTP